MDFLFLLFALDGVKTRKKFVLKSANVITGMKIDCARNHLDFIVLLQEKVKEEKTKKNKIHIIYCV